MLKPSGRAESTVVSREMTAAVTNSCLSAQKRSSLLSVESISSSATTMSPTTPPSLNRL